MNEKNKKEIHTPQLLIKGNIMIWDRQMIQLSNVSSISTMPMEKSEFPKLSVALLILGFFLFKEYTGIAFAMLLAGAGWLYFWYKGNSERDLKKILSISMNSGSVFYIIFNNQWFLDEVLKLLQQIIIDNGVDDKVGNKIENKIENKFVSINVKDSKISGNASILDNFKAF